MIGSNSFIGVCKHLAEMRTKSKVGIIVMKHITGYAVRISLLCLARLTPYTVEVRDRLKDARRNCAAIPVGI